MIRVKICGIMDVKSAVAAAEKGADFLGMVFAPSRRQIELNKAVEIAAAVRRSVFDPPLMAGVFVNENADKVNLTAEQCELDYVQLSGDENLEYCRSIVKPLIKVVHIDESTTAERVINEIEDIYSELQHARPLILLDTKVKDIYGGSGQTFDRKIAREIAEKYPVIIAGGLNPDNIMELIKEVKPWGVDVSSGVETQGQKDLEKFDNFIKNAKGF